MAAPMPLDAPVTTATLPVSLLMSCLTLVGEHIEQRQVGQQDVCPRRNHTLTSERGDRDAAFRNNCPVADSRCMAPSSDAAGTEAERRQVIGAVARHAAPAGTRRDLC